MKKLYQIMVPTIYGDTEKPIKTRHHKEWDKKVRAIAGGLTINAVSKGQWVDPETGKLWTERVIPVQIMCDSERIDDIIDMTLNHYRQISVMYCVISDEVYIVNNTPRSSMVEHSSHKR